MNDQNKQVQNTDDKTIDQKQNVSIAQTKEAEPIVVTEPLIVASETEPRLHPEVEAAGVEAVDEKLRLTEEHLKIGLNHAKESTPVKTDSASKIQYPISESDARKALKIHQRFKKSIAWLALSVLRQIDVIRGGKK
ncbi:MAG TPA: hypothetical protein VFD45_02810 [Patescibacteria group bacterium]|nr:hypothetical protein [Patescibacteria group bacterium]